MKITNQLLKELAACPTARDRFYLVFGQEGVELTAEAATRYLTPALSSKYLTESREKDIRWLITELINDHEIFCSVCNSDIPIPEAIELCNRILGERTNHVQEEEQ